MGTPWICMKMRISKRGGGTPRNCKNIHATPYAYPWICMKINTFSKGGTFRNDMKICVFPKGYALDLYEICIPCKGLP